MASVSSLDQDMRNLRMSRYTTQTANEARSWIEDTLGESLPSGDLLEVLKDGVALCKLANLALPPPGVKFKASPMPFIQMENISHFLRACESQPLNMPAHDRFLTVDLYEGKDPAQVLQCLSAFSRVANATNPAKFPTTIGPRKSGTSNPVGATSAHRNGVTAQYVSGGKPSYGSARPLSPVRTGGSATSSQADGSVKSGPVSSWSRKGDEGITSPAWNIHQYGYMGGASQGNQGISFGGRRQITSPAPQVPSLADKERKRREKEEEDERIRVQAEEAEHKRRVERDAEEERERASEEQRWEEETRRVRDEQRMRLEEQKRQWEEQERKWKADEEARLREEAEDKRMTSTQPERPRGMSDAIPRGQYLSQYQSEQKSAQPEEVKQADTPEQRRVKDLERQLEEARERERQYQQERESRLGGGSVQSTPVRTEDKREPQLPDVGTPKTPVALDERDFLRQQWQNNQQDSPRGSTAAGSTRPLPAPSSNPAQREQSQRSLAEPESPPSLPSPPQGTASPETRPLPSPSNYQPQPQTANRTDRYLSHNPAPAFTRPQTHQPAEMGFSSTLEEQADRDRRVAAQQKTKAGGWASKSLLEREMERERERQREWEANQETTKTATRDVNAGSGPGQSWDVHQYGYTGGDSQNKGSSAGSGIGFGGRRQIIGPRPPP